MTTNSKWEPTAIKRSAFTVQHVRIRVYHAGVVAHLYVNAAVAQN